MKVLQLCLLCVLCVARLEANPILKWKVKGSLLNARHRFCLSQISDNKVLVIGGITADNRVTNSTEIFDLVDGTVEYGPLMNEPHSECDIVTMPNKNVIIISGTNNGTTIPVTGKIEEYDIVTNKWNVIGTVLTPRRQHSSILLNEQEILVVGGRDKDLNTLTSTEVFNLKTRTSREVGALPLPVNNGKLAQLQNGEIVFFGGRVNGDGSVQTDKIFVFDIHAFQWREYGNIPKTTSYPAVRKLEDGRIVVCGGKYEPTSNYLKEVFIESEKGFKLLSMMMSERHGGYVEQLDQNRILTFGGFDNTNNNLTSSEITHLDNGLVESGPALNVPHSSGPSIRCIVKKNGLEVPTIYVFSGKSANNILTTSVESLENSSGETAEVSGIINIYTPVIEIENGCNAMLQVKNSTGFSVGDKVLIIQMQGAQISESNNSTYGSIRNYMNAGNHEFSRITGISGNVIHLHNHLLLSYNLISKVQLVKVPEYKDVEVIGELTCKEWDGETGGILVFSVSGQTTLKSNLNVNGKGFRGAKAISTDNHPFYYVGDYIVESDKPGYSAPKGEGIAEYGVFPFTNGKGAPANGGGGGGNHNTGGAGGSNYGCGGEGSVGWISTHYSGDNLITQSIGGYPLEVIKNRIFMGGGGGAGHSNQNDLGHGGNGGGIIIIQTKSLNSNGYKILAEGYDGIESTVDGSGGGGGGGSVYLETEENKSNVYVSVKGGKGANNRYTGYDIPPGGGGGGGVILLKSDVTNGTFHLDGGENGLTSASYTDYGAKSGCNGTIIKNVDIAENRNTGSVNGTQTLPNRYYRVTAINQDRTKVIVDVSPALCSGNKVLIIQMKGAEISKVRDNGFGSITSLNSCGNYEFARIANVEDNQVTMEKPLTRFYDPTASVQLVTVPEYVDFTVTSPLSCKPWDGQIGGVLTFCVEKTLFLNSRIDVSGNGFHGGLASNSLTNPPEHVSELSQNIDSSSTSRKGEGIYITQDNEKAGRGATATGGGGGNNHNAGGGGGSNAGCGGKGGFGWQMYKGDRIDAQGFGGYSIKDVINKIFMGGGGGAGHSNEKTGTSGGNGGGIVILQAKKIVSDNESIISRGISASNAAFDGCGGGGAGGSVVLDCHDIVNQLSIDVRGGSGGSTTDHRDGPGGGGGGGFALFSSDGNLKNVNVLLNGGGNGTNRDFASDGATTGCDGKTVFNISVPGDSTILSDIPKLNKEAISQQASISPNPASEYIVVISQLVETNLIIVQNYLGETYKLKVQTTNSGYYVDISSLSQGLYFVKTKLTDYPFFVFR